MKEIFDAIERARLAGLRVTVEMRVSTTHTITVNNSHDEILNEFVISAFNDNKHIIDRSYVSSHYPKHTAGSVQEMIDNFERGDYENRMDWK